MSSLCSHVETVLRLSLKALDVRPGAIIGDWLARPIHDVLAEQANEPFCTFAGGDLVYTDPDVYVPTFLLGSVRFSL
jgi:hypothetical protein